MSHTLIVKTIEVRYNGNSDGPRLDIPREAGEFLVDYFQTLDSDVEHFGVLVLDQRHNLIGLKILHTGTRAEAPVDAGKLYRIADRLGATGIIIFHNHPSRDIEPSRNDYELTRRLVEAGRLIDIKLHDHMIVTPDDRWLSLRESRAAAFA